MRTVLLGFAMALMAAAAPRAAAGAEIKVLTAGAFKQVLLALVPDFERATAKWLCISVAWAEEIRFLSTAPLSVSWRRRRICARNARAQRALAQSQTCTRVRTQR